MQHDNCPYKQEAEQLRKDFEEFAYIVSHDLKAPVRAISNLSSWIEEDLGEDIPAEVQQNLQLLRGRTSRMERMMEALLLYSRITRQDLQVKPTAVDDLVREVAEKLTEARRLELRLPVPLPLLHTYQHKLRQVFENLLQNTVLFSSQPQVPVTVTATEQTDCFVFTVEDQGPGVPAEALEKIFTLFYTVAPKDKLQTVGAGLAITQKIVRFAGGSIWAENSAAGGLKVQFSWPKSENIAIENTAP